MAKIACELSDIVILTSDNPRNEEPEDILADMQAGVSITHRRKVNQITDRREAIKKAAQMAGPQDIILVAGKGHETYQEIEGVRHDFDDLKISKITSTCRIHEIIHDVSQESKITKPDCATTK